MSADKVEKYQIIVQMNIVYSIEAKNPGAAVELARQKMLQQGDYQDKISFNVIKESAIPEEQR